MQNPKSVSILIRGGTQHIVDESERALVDAIGAVSSAIETGKFWWVRVVAKQKLL